MDLFLRAFYFRGGPPDGKLCRREWTCSTGLGVTLYYNCIQEVIMKSQLFCHQKHAVRSAHSVPPILSASLRMDISREVLNSDCEYVAGQ